MLGALSPWAAAPAEAQTDTLVTNFNQKGDGRSNQNAAGQGFTTGSVYPYFLSSIDVIARTSTTAEERANLRAELWSASGNVPGAKIADLTVPADAGADLGTYRDPTYRRQTNTHSTSQHGRFVSFAAPANTRLEPNTTYFLFVRGRADLNLGWDSTRRRGVVDK
ncbi:MAG: hypothetical protein OXD40_11825, partial [bacterium]|nr:hypothetical protein [bacterium]